MKYSRRRFLQIAGVSALGLGAKPVLDAFAAGGARGPGFEIRRGEAVLTATQWAMIIDTRKLQRAQDLQPMIDACNFAHNVPTGIANRNHAIKWIWAAPYHNAFPDKINRFVNHAVEHRPFLLLCNHCENPSCVRVCPTRATFKRPSDGVVMMDYHRCIGCRFCMAACPYAARSFNFRDPRPFIREVNTAFPTRMIGVVEKCNFCAERLAVGKAPACVEVSGGAMTFGDLYDPDSQVRRVLNDNYTIRRKASLGTEPSVYYIV